MIFRASDLSPRSQLHLAGGIPLILLLPGLIRTWTESRLDQNDWIFFVLFALAYLCFRPGPPVSRPRSRGSILFCVMTAGGILLSLHIHVNALLTFFCIFFWLGIIWFCKDWQQVWNLLPVFMILCAGIPGSSYWISTVLNLHTGTAFLMKCLISLLCLGWAAVLRRGTLPVPEPEECFFSMLWLLSLLSFWQNSRLSILGHHFTPAFVRTAGSYHGLDTAVSADTRRFFASSQVRQLLYLTPQEEQIHVLHIRCGTDVHEIHPASFCLKTSRWTLQKEHFLQIGDRFHVTEIIAERRKHIHLIWVWYSNDVISTPSFLSFRKKFRCQKNWQFFQISTPVTSDLAHAQSILRNFLRNLAKAENHAEKK